jgi:hypothetical protein
LTSKMHSRLPNAQTCSGRAGSSATQMASQPNSCLRTQPGRSPVQYAIQKADVPQQLSHVWRPTPRYGRPLYDAT